jgi:TonB family protein
LRNTAPERFFGRSVAQPRLQPEARRAAAAPAPSALAGIGAAAPQQYYPTRELDEKPLLTEHVEPRFPEGAPVGGRVVVRLYINRSGTVDRVEVLAADPAGLFDGEAIRAFGASRFLPGKKAGIPVNASMDIEALFGAPIPAQSVELQSRPPEEPRRPPPYVPRGAPSTSRR